MLRDSPYIIGLIVILAAFIGIGFVWFVSDINEDTAVTSLNETLRGTTINQVDLASRVDPGQVYLNQEGAANIAVDPEAEVDYESEVLNNITTDLPTDSIARFDYMTNNQTTDVPATTYVYTAPSEDAETDIGTWQEITNYSDEDLSLQDQTVDYLTDNTRALELDESVNGVQLRIRRAGYSANVLDPTDTDFWSYQSTVEVNRSDNITTVMDEGSWDSYNNDDN